MSPHAREWVVKAEADFSSAEREYRARKKPNYDAACFFAQQYVEKTIKARLVQAGINFPKTHDLSRLLDLVLPVEPMWEAFRTSFNELTSYASAFRYPGDSATREIAKKAINTLRQLRPSLDESSWS
jgi:HEPN domain-containing protein